MCYGGQPGTNGIPVCMACRVPLEHLAVMDVTESKEIRAARERLGPRDQLVQKERKEIRESLEPRAPQAKKDSEGRKVRVELQDLLSFPRTWTGKNAPGKRLTAKTQEWSRQVIYGTRLQCYKKSLSLVSLISTENIYFFFGITFYCWALRTIQFGNLLKCRIRPVSVPSHGRG